MIIKTKKIFLSSALAILIAAPAFVSAHHSVPVNFNTKDTIVVTGTILKTKWSNPHSQITIEVNTATGFSEVEVPESETTKENSGDDTAQASDSQAKTIEDPAIAEKDTDAGEKEIWLVEMNALNTIRRMSKRMNMNITDFVVGEELIVTGWRGRNSKAVYFRKAVLQSGQEIVWETRLDPDLQKIKK